MISFLGMSVDVPLDRHSEAAVTSKEPGELFLADLQREVGHDETGKSVGCPAFARLLEQLLIEKLHFADDPYLAPTIYPV